MSYQRDPEDPDFGKPIIHHPSRDEVALAVETREICGECKYFEIAHGRALMRGQRFVETLVREHGWKMHHLCSPLNQLGVCGAGLSGAKGEEATVTGFLHKGCDQFRRKNGLVSISRKTTDPTPT